MGRVAIWVSIVFLLGLNLLQLKFVYDVTLELESAKNRALKAENAAVAASDAQIRSQELGHALIELKKALLELEATVGKLTQRVELMPAVLKKETLDEAKALIPAAVDEDQLRSSVLTAVNERLDVESANAAQLRSDLTDQMARLEKRLLVEMKDKKEQSFHVKQPLPQGEPTEPASPYSAIQESDLAPN